MDNKPIFLVFSSPYEQEENECKSCFILTELPYKEINTFVDYLDRHTSLSVDAYMHHDTFQTNVGVYRHCTVIEVHLKGEAEDPALSCEQISIEETGRYLKQQ